LRVDYDDKPALCAGAIQNRTNRPAMYLAHWELARSPFGPGASGCYPSAAHQEAEARVDYLLSQQRRLGVLISSRGGGKSTTLRAILDQQRSQGAGVAIVEGVALSVHELLWQVTRQWGGSPELADDPYRLWRRVEEVVTEARWRNRRLLVAIDDAGQLPTEVQQQLARLIRLEPDAALTALLALEPGHVARLDETLLHLVDLRIDLNAWDEADTIGYVQTALVDAGRLSPVFTDDALTHLHALTQGVPRHVARLADFALLTGAGLLIDEIDAEIVQSAFDEICWSPVAVA